MPFVANNTVAEFFLLTWKVRELDLVRKSRNFAGGQGSFIYHLYFSAVAL